MLLFAVLYSVFSRRTLSTLSLSSMRSRFAIRGYIVWCILLPGCVSLSVRARVGPAVSSEGTPSIQGGISLGVGLTPGQAVGEVTVSSRNKERWTSTGIDWWLGAPEVEAYRVGLRAGARVWRSRNELCRT